MSTKKRLLTNFLSLASMQGLNLLLPVITLPYLLQTLGPGKFGLISFAQALIQYFILFTDYGFNLVATRDIAISRESKEKVSTIVSTVLLVRILLMAVCFIVLFVLITFIPRFQDDSLIYLYTFGMVVGNVLFPIWYFQGMEQMKIISILNIIAKSIFTIGIFIFVKSENQFLLVPILNSFGYIAIGIAALYIMFVNHHIRFIWPSKNHILHQLKEGWHIFVSNVVTSLYTTSNTFVLGFFASDIIVGYYSSAEKVVKAVSSIISPLIQTIYPYLNRALTQSKERALWILSRAFFLITLAMGLLSLAVGFGAETLVHLIDPEFHHSVPLLQIMAALPLILGWANVFGILTMINFDYKKELSRIYIVTSIISIILMVTLIPIFKQYGTAVNALITEAFATMLMAVFLWKKGIILWSWKRYRREH
ncbi:flippase [Bacillaceae bacterium Marseille-Q3522]|nr:flippase [Bacillaceae bacterium Marseille-Q3522]